MNKLLVIDLETSSLQPFLGSILEIGAVLLSRDGEVVDVIDVIVQPPETDLYWKDCWAITNTSLTVQDVLNANHLQHIKPKLQDYLDEYPTTAYNRMFDIRFLKFNGFTIPHRAECPMLIAKSVLKLPGFNGGYKYPSFAEVWNFFMDTPHEVLHRALDDAQHEARVIHQMCEFGHYPWPE